MPIIWPRRGHMMAINPLEFNERAEFGVEGTTGYNPKNGNPTKGFMPAFSRWFGYINQSLNQQYTLAGESITNTKLIAIRHDASINDQLNVRIGGDVYKIILISSDDRSARETFDLLTLQKVVKNG